MAALLELVNFLPSEYTDESGKLITVLGGGNLRIGSIEELTKTNLKDIEDELSIEVDQYLFRTHQVLIKNSGLGKAEIVYNDYIDGDIDAPDTKREQFKVDNVWNEFFSTEKPERQLVTRQISSDYIADYSLTSTTHPFKVFQSLSLVDFKSSLSPAFYEVLANYLVNAAKRYIQYNNRTYTAYGRIVDSVDTDKGLKGARINLLEDSNYVGTGYAYSNAKGFFSLRFSSLEEVTSDITLLADIEVNGFETALRESILFDPDNLENVVSIELVASQINSTDLGDSELNTIMSNLPQSVQDFIDEPTNNINTLADLRSVGLLRNRTEIDLSQGTPAQKDNLKKLDSLALLELVNPDVSQNLSLQSDYQSFVDVAKSTRTSFLNKHESTFGNKYEATKIYDAAVQLTKLAANHIGQPKDGLNPANDDPNLKKIVRCECDECKSAVGPMAYLTDLLSFAYENITYDDNGTEKAIDDAWIQTNLNQDIESFPVDCGTLKDDVCQARIATEVLRKETGDLSGNSEFIVREYQYLEEAYRTLLNKLGTSFDELLRFQSEQDFETRNRYANRIGIVLETIEGTSEETIKQLFRSVERTGDPDTDITEEFLETHFGVPRTIVPTSPTLSEEVYMNIWRKARQVELWKERDYINNPYHNGEKIIIDPDIVTVDDFRVPDITNSTAYKIWINRRDFIDAQFNNLFDESSINQQFLEMQDPGGVTYSTIPPQVDTLINPIWQSSSLQNLEDLAMEIRNGDNEKIDVLYTTYGLLPKELFRFNELLAKDANDVTINEVAESANILTQAIKRKFESSWLDEEEANGIELSSKEFWISENEPKVGEWPLIVNPDPGNIDPKPLIDPELITSGALPELTFRTLDIDAVSSVYNTRITALNVEKDILVNDEATSATSAGPSIPEKIDFAFQGTSYVFEDTIEPISAMTFVQLEADLNNPSESDTATNTINDTLKISLDDFNYLMTLSRKTLENISTAEWERFYSITLTARKLHHLYSSWVSDDEDTVNNGKYWQLRKANLPLWRASKEDRKSWQSAYKEHNKRPIIDPNLIGPAYLVKPIEGQKPFDRWLERFNDVTGEKDTIEGAFNSDLATFETLLEDYLFENTGVKLKSDTASDITIESRREGGEDISKVLEQLQISFGDYNFLVQVWDVLSDPPTPPLEPLSADQKERIYSVFLKLYKRRKFYSYRVEEEADETTQSPDYFLDRSEDYNTYPPTIPYPLNEYLVSKQDLNNWRRTVSSREEEVESKALAYKELLHDVDDENIPFLRDALVEFESTDYGNVNLDEKARLLGDKLLIDLQDNCCFKTNRAAQAIETLQQLLWKTNTGDILSDYSDLKLHTESFNTVWTWMGSYANWRASMFVFLYPENILQPSLKKNATPIFKSIIRDTQNDRRFNPRGACEIAKEYREYIADVNSLELKCSVQAKVITQKEDECNSSAQIIENLTFVFATASNSGKSYFTTVKSADDAFSQHSLWNTIPVIPDNAILKGGDYYFNKDRDIKHVYLFYTVEEFDKYDKFYAMRFDCVDNKWEDDSHEYTVDKTELKIIDQETNSSHFQSEAVIDQMEIKIKNLTICQGRRSYDRLQIAINLKAKAQPTEFKSIVLDGVTYSRQLTNHFDKDYELIFTRTLGDDGTKLNEDNYRNTWNCFVSKNLENVDSYAIGQWTDLFEYYTGLSKESMFGEIDSMLFIEEENPNPSNDDWQYWYGNTYYFITKRNNQDTLIKRFFTDTLKTATAFEKDFNPTVPIQYNFYSLFEDETFVLFKDEENATVYERYIANDSNTVLSTLFNYKEKTVPFGGKYVIGNGARVLVTQNMETLQISVRRHIYNSVSSSISFQERLILNPSFNQIPSFDPNVDNIGRDYLRIDSEENLETNLLSSNPKLRLYPEEAYYNLPMHIALKLSSNGYYQEALDWFRLVYDYYADEGYRKIYHGLILEEQFDSLQDRIAEWYEDPLNPHAIANTRKNTHTRFVIMSIANCLMSYANAEYSIDNSETVPRARELYEDMIDLLAVLDSPNDCDKGESIRTLESFLDNDPKWKDTWNKEFKRLYSYSGTSKEYTELESAIETAIDNSNSNQVKLDAVRTEIDSAFATIDIASVGGKVSDYSDEMISQIGYSLAQNSSSDTDSDVIYHRAVQESHANTNKSLTAVTGYDSEELVSKDLDWLITGDAETEHNADRDGDPTDNSKQNSLYKYGYKNPRTAMALNNPFEYVRLSGMNFSFCVVPNPFIKAFKMAALANLYKIHNCMNIAGMKRELNPFAAPTDNTSGMPSVGLDGLLQLPGQLSAPPSNFRYQYLVERAKQLVSIAQQMEGSLLQSLEKFDSENYLQFKAKQDIELAKGNVKLQNLKIKESQSNLKLAELQQERAQIQVDGLQGMIDEGFLSAENNLISNYNVLLATQISLTIANNLINNLKANLDAATGGGGVTAAASIAAGFGISAAIGFSGAIKTGIEIQSLSISNSINLNSLYASLQRRQQEWNYQKSIANQDVKIGGQQVKIANDRIRIVGQEREIAQIQLDQAKATLDFLKTKFTSAELYEWMSNVLEDIYDYFLQEATAIAKLAEQQLSFERQISLPNLIKSDYWVQEANNSMDIGGGNSDVDRKGLTGSARLLKDVTELDQYAFDTTQRKLQIVKTFSLNQHDPVRMEQFRNTGIFNFITSRNDFDRDFPGHYMRLIKNVSVSVIALTPPVDGIKATLLNSGISNVTVGGRIFQPKTIARNPERIALSSPYNDSGLLQLQADDRLLRPFEGSGVESNWELRMEKPSNDFDYRSIADVLFTVEYEAMHDEQFSNIVKGQLNQNAEDRSIVLSLKNNLPDTWFDLMNPDDETGITSSFEISESDLAPHINDARIKNVKVLISVDINKVPITDSNDSPNPIISFGDAEFKLTLTNSGQEKASEPDVLVELNEFIITDEPVVINLQDTFIERGPLGAWDIGLTNGSAVRTAIANEQLNDIIIIITYEDSDSIQFSVEG